MKRRRAGYKKREEEDARCVTIRSTFCHVPVVKGGLPGGRVLLMEEEEEEANHLAFTFDLLLRLLTQLRCNLLRKPREWPFTFARHSVPSSSLKEKFGHLRGACDAGPIQFKTSAQRVNSDGNKKKEKKTPCNFLRCFLSLHTFLWRLGAKSPSFLMGRQERNVGKSIARTNWLVARSVGG